MTYAVALAIRSYTDLTPEEARRKLAQYNLSLFREQFDANFFIKDVRSDVYLRNEIRAFWEGRIKEMHGWTDVLGQLRDWFVNTILNPVMNLLRPIWDAIKGVVDSIMKALDPIWEALRNAISGLGQAIWGFLSQGFSWLVNAIMNLVSPVVDAIRNFAGWIWEQLSKGFQWISDAVRNFSGWLWEKISAGFQWISNAVSAIGSAVGSAVSGVVSTLAKIGDMFMGALKWLWDNVIVPIGNVVKAGINTVVGALGNIASMIVYSLIGAVRSHSPMTPEESFANIPSVLQVAGAMLATLGIAYVVGEIAHPLKEMGLGHLAAMIWNASNYDIVTGAIIGAFATAAFGTPLRYYFNSMFQPYMPEESDVYAMKFRGMIDTNTYYRLMGYRGYRKEFADMLLEVRKPIPGIGDLVTFAVRESYPLERLPPAPDEFVKDVSKHGLDEKYARAYWWIHWKLPAFENIREALWRNIISTQEFAQYVVWHDYAPFARPGISKSDQEIMMQLAYRLPSRIEARYMLKWGYIGKDELKNFAIAEGLHPDWTEKVASAEYDNLLSDEKTAVRSVLKSLYRNGYITEQVLRMVLKDVRFTDPEIELSVKAADLDRTGKLADMRVDNAITKYKYGYINENQLSAELTAAGVDPVFVQLLIPILKPAKNQDKLQTPKEEVRAFGREVAISRFVEGLTTEVELEQELKLLGYSDEEVQRAKVFAILKRDYNFAMGILSTLRTAYRNKKIGDDMFLSLCAQYGISRDKALHELNLEKIRRGTYVEGEAA